MRFIAIADSDSYLAWSAAFLGALPDVTERELILIDTPVLPSETQRGAARAIGGVEPDRLLCLPSREVLVVLRRERPDAVLVALRGPAAAVLIRMIAELPVRPVIVTGLPGIAIPATRKTLVFRRHADLFVLHSRREIREFTRLSRENGWTHRFALATLPVVEERTKACGGDLVFAAQALVPLAREKRERLLEILLDAASADPTRRVVITGRGPTGVRRPDDDVIGFPELLERARASGAGIPSNVIVSTAPMSTALASAQGLLTVSSTAAIEAIARGIPVIALDSFGVADALHNPVFEGSGLFGGEEAVVRREFRHPEPAWLVENYFHPVEGDDVAVQLQALVAARRQGVLPAREPARQADGTLRLAWDRQREFAVGARARAKVNAMRQVTRGS